ncbi:MAG: hypothetical protein KatS3mg082_2933 [Nitrospiraceae bacterium]|nr:MAG: hypothetical protein KatS3mg081_2458 [Gemmatimonadales bacterium]GIW56529.1 MAG: hypothetical protein KatS3mg082_2933 [Nitrospiraceae bacterium]
MSKRGKRRIAVPARTGSPGRDMSAGKGLIERLAKDLSGRFGRGFSRQNLWQMRQFYLAYPPERILQTLSGDFDGAEILQTVSGELDPIRPALASLEESRNASPISRLSQLARCFPLPWSAYVRLLSLRSDEARRFYEDEALRGGWSVRQLDRQIQSQFYERTALSRSKAAMLQKGARPKPEEALTPEEEIKDPYVFDLKLGRFTHAGQMHVYLNYAVERWSHEGEAPPVGLILCAQKNQALARYALDNLPNNVLAAEYRAALTVEKLLAAEIAETRRRLEGRRGMGGAR